MARSSKDSITYGKIAGYKQCCIDAFHNREKRSQETKCCMYIIRKYTWLHVLCNKCAGLCMNGGFSKISDFIDIDSRNHNIATSDNPFAKRIKPIEKDEEVDCNTDIIKSIENVVISQKKRIVELEELLDFAKKHRHESET
jgi:hypothetical protein